MSDRQFKRNVLTFAAGAAAGGVAALLLAPMKGEDLRAKIADEAESKRDAAGEKLQELSRQSREKVSEMSTRAQDKAREITDRASERLDRTRDRTEQVVARGKEGARDHGQALSAAVRAGLDAYEQSLNGRT